MDTTTTRQHLLAWAASRDERAFRCVVERYAGMVHGAARRRTGSPELAADAAQAVFVKLAQKAREAAAHPAAWLHRAAVYEAQHVLRSEYRHRRRVEAFAAAAVSDPPGHDTWSAARTHLDEALDALPAMERRVLLLRYFEEQTAAQIGAALGVSTEAAQKRATRALDRLTGLLRRRGVAVPAAVLAAGLTPQLSQAAPAGLTAHLTTAAVSAPAAGFFSSTFAAMSAAKLATAAVVLVSAALPVGVRLAAQLPDAPARTVQTQQPDGAAPAASPAPLDPTLVQQAISRLLSDPGDYRTRLELRRLMFSLSAAELPAVRKLLMAVRAKKTEDLYEVAHAFFARWAELEPMAACEAAFALPKSAFGFAPVKGAFITWAAADLDVAWAWLEKKTSDSFDREFLGGGALAAIAADPQQSAAIMARVDAMKDHEWREKMRYWVMRAWVDAREPEAAMDWAGKLAGGEERAEWSARTVQLVGERHPITGLNNLHRIENPDRLGEVAHNILWPWLLAQPQEAFAELAKHTADWPEDLFRFAGDALTRHDAAQAVAAARTLPEGKLRDLFIRGALIGAGYSDPAALLPALGMITEQQLVESGGLSHFTKILASRDPDAAAKWIAAFPAGSTVRQWTESTFQSTTGHSTASHQPSTPR